MPLITGVRLGPYEIESAIGTGGMGEVYRARDTRLDRTVAIKVLPSSLADDEQFRGRFDREARAISALSHPHICALFDVGTHEGMSFLVMEHLNGESLEARLAAKGGTGLPLREGLAIAIDVASALDAAHRAGIVHRDLKPGNVMLTKAGAKLLDFGLAKTAPAVAGPAGPPGTMAPTVSSPPPTITQQGAILGTFQYMAPEQIEGLEADARTDIFAFGALLFEMLTGKRAFEGKTRASLIGSILKDEPPPISRMQPVAPPSLDRIVATCLAKDPDDRWQTARDLLRELKWAADSHSNVAQAGANVAQAGSSVAQGFSPAPRRALLPWAIAASALVVAGTMLVVWAPWRQPPPSRLVRLNTEIADGVSLNTVGVPGNNIALSQTGDLLAFVGQQSPKNPSQLFIRRLDQLQATALPGTDDAGSPFFSPDGQWVAFFSSGQLKKIAVTGGPAVTLCDAPNNRGGAWSDDNTIVLAPNNLVALQRVSSSGGTPEPLTRLADGEVTQRWPQVLPGGKAVLFSSAAQAGNMDNGDIVVQALPDGPRKVLQRGGYYGRYVASGHIIYIHGGTLFAAPFDLPRLELTGPPVPVLEGVNGNTGTGAAQFTVSRTGTLMYVAGLEGRGETAIMWMDRDGKATPLRAMLSDWSNPQFSPDGTRLAMDVSDGRRIDVAVYDWARDTLTRLTFGPAYALKPAWTPDGHRIVFQSTRPGGGLNLYWMRADGSGEAQRLTESRNTQLVGSWHPGGKLLAYMEANPTTAGDLMILPMGGDEASGWKPGKPTAFLNTPANEQEPMFSPDGRWIAYSSNEAGGNEVYVRRYPGPGGKWQISSGGGLYPMWSRTRNELFFQGANGQISVASYTVEGDSFRADKPRLWGPGRYRGRPRFRSMDLHPDGNRIALAALEQSENGNKLDKVVVMFNVFDELRRIAPVSK